MNIVVQIGYHQAETWAARVYGNAKFASLEEISSLPLGWMPVGGMAFCRAAMAHHNITEPESLDYPECLCSWAPYGGHVLSTYGELTAEGWTDTYHHGIHAKPVQSKLDKSLWTPETAFWAAPYHRFASEWRVYIIRGKIVGMGRYDDRNVEDEDTHLNMDVVHNMVDTYTAHGAPAGYGLDVGVSDEDGMTKLVEVNDGWALGYYKGDCSMRNYMNLLEVRWSEMIG